MADEKKKEIPLHRERLNLPNKDELQKIKEKKKSQLAKDMAQTFNSVSGRATLRFILDICGYKKSKVGGNPALGMDVLVGTMYNSARENVAIEILDYVPDYIIRDVEHGTDRDLIE